MEKDNYHDRVVKANVGGYAFRVEEFCKVEGLQKLGIRFGAVPIIRSLVGLCNHPLWLCKKAKVT